ncbi:NAD(P)-dependent oxidoreductase [Arthrobacter sp. ISL-30]|uniref:NAD-dependent epimerase/dehydratase family protein n=1 Tax=Arthrobacter sp. ISL-30 TaxID=2819109 RepID=UPI001BEB47D7|nr:NAD-dependent epimerase/dehydratase family protein [Arthrobacter sp. ISL-30]MBT2513691.1 NAD-dependent epimerase/dehydratase family protein [Arthrobacter sp. ISL-30]
MATERGGDSDQPLVVVTGAAGRVGQLTSAALAGSFRLRLVDRAWPGAAAEGGRPGRHPGGADDVEGVTLDLANRAACDEAVSSADILIHLAGQAYPQIDEREAIDGVAVISANLAAAAAGSSLRRVIYASSIHTMGLYHRRGQYPISTRWPAKPCCEYGAAKVFSENLMELLAERTGISVICLRLGLTGFDPASEDLASQWLGQGDYARLLNSALAARVRFGAYFGMSPGAMGRWDLTDTVRDLGFHPLDAPPPAYPAFEEDPAAGRCLMFGPQAHPGASHNA